MSNSLKWIVENMTEAAEDLEQELDLDNNEGVPLVPIGEEDVLAMDNALFKRTLTALGIQKPANEQVNKSFNTNYIFSNQNYRYAKRATGYLRTRQ